MLGQGLADLPRQLLEDQQNITNYKLVDRQSPRKYRVINLGKRLSAADFYALQPSEVLRPC